MEGKHVTVVGDCALCVASLVRAKKAKEVADSESYLKKHASESPSTEAF